MAESKPITRLQVVVAFGLVYVLWGSTYIGIRLAVEHLPPLMMGGLRFIASGALMLAFCVARGTSIAVSGKQLFRLSIIGILLLTTGNVVLGWAETKIPTSLAALLIAITPLWFLLLEKLSSHGDHISARGVVGIALGVLGVVVLLWPDFHTLNFRGGSLLGAPLVLFSSFSWASGSILTKRWHIDLDPYTSSGWQMLMAGLINGAMSLAVGDLHRTVWARSSLLAVLYLVIAGSLIGFTAYVWLLRNVPTPKVATYAYVNPIVAVFLGWLILGEKLTPYMMAGAVVIILSVVLVTGAKLKRRDAHTPADEELAPIESAGD
ncbi:MAG TPA: EamA family transporter [Candidatus Acidoferrales bacterium]|nr:EamA family transporter [Candidatus Acidoferrales bacterium]